MAERDFPEQRDRFSGAPESEIEHALSASSAPYPDGDELDHPVFDEAFVRAACVREPSARTRMLEARWRNSPPKAQPWREEADSKWTVRPSRHLRSLRISAAGWIVCAVAATVLILALTR
jgi:hypothetical protein